MSHRKVKYLKKKKNQKSKNQKAGAKMGLCNIIINVTKFSL